MHVQATVLPNLFARLIKQLYTLVYIHIRNWCVGGNDSATTILVMSRTHAINTIRIPTYVVGAVHRTLQVLQLCLQLECSLMSG